MLNKSEPVKKTMFARLYYQIVTMVFMNGVPLLALQDQKNTS